MSAPDWVRRFRAARVSLPVWALHAPQRTTYATNASGVWQIVSWDRDEGRHTTLTDKPTGVLGGTPLPDGSGVAWFDDHAGDEVGRYVVTPFYGGGARPLVPEIDEGWAGGLSLRTGRIAVGSIRRDGTHLYVTDEEGTREVYRHAQPADIGGLSRDGRLLAVAHTEHGDAMHPAVRLLDPAGGEVLADLWDGEGMTVTPAGWSRVPGDARLAIHADRSGRTRPELYDAAGGERIPLELDLPGEVWVADWWPGGTALLLAHDHLGRTELHRYDLRAHRADPLELTDGTVRAARVRDDGSIWYAFSSSARPPEIRVRDDAGDRPLLRPPGDPAPPGAAYESLHYDNGEGGQVHAFLATPPAEAPHPLVVTAHGGPAAACEDSFDPSVQAWVDHGFAVLLPNYRGSTGYGKRWEDAVLGDPGRPEVVDLLAGRDRLVDDGTAAAGRVVLTGGSWGGYLTLQALGTQPHAWDAGIAVVPVADYVSAVADESPALREFDRTIFGGMPDEAPDLYRERSPITYADRVRAPVLIITGANDTRCPKRQVDNYVAALRAHGVPHAYEVYDAGHGTLEVAEAIRQQALAIDFAAEHLGTPVAQR